LTIDDLYDLGWAEDLAISPDGRSVAYVRVAVDRAANRYRRTLWLAAADGTRPRRLSAGPRSDTTPRWSPDGRSLAFISDRDGERPQVYVIELTGGEARRITNHPQGASEPAWSPDGRRLAFLARLTPEEAAREDAGEQPDPNLDEIERRHARERRAHEEQRRFDPRVITRIPYRGGTTYFDGRHSQIYMIDVPQDDEAEPGQPRRLTDGELDHGPLTWAADGRSILTSRGRDPEADTLFGFNDLLRVPVPETGRAAPQALTRPGFSYDAPQPSPDGRWIAARRRDEGRPLAHGAELVVLPAEGGQPRLLTEHTDLNAEQFQWAPGSDALLFTAAWWGEQPIYSAALAGGPEEASELLPGGDGRPPELVAAAGRVISEFDVAPDGSIAFIAGSATNPCELYLRRPDGQELRLTDVSERVLRKRTPAAFEELRYPAPDGTAMQGWVLYPPDFDASKTYPLVVHIHGGPHLMWAPGMRNMWHELQVTAARGYITFFCNPRGSDGYGEAWRDGLHNNWGAAAADILAGVDLLVARGHVDTHRMAVTGGSYGGYMTAWIIAHDQRFACAVAARGVYDLLSFHGTSDAHELIEFEFDGVPWERRDLLWEQSPIAHAHMITTPLRILHAELDWRVPIAQAEQLFSNLRRRRVPVELVRYPREGHELTRAGEPDHRADHMRRTIEWLDRFCSVAE
jgi:dipeptidyl aminopeptidase/acylaminoacyl peptidase